MSVFSDVLANTRDGAARDGDDAVIGKSTVELGHNVASASSPMSAAKRPRSLRGCMTATDV